MSIQIIYARPDLIPSFYKALDRVAREEIYIEKVEAPPFSDVESFQQKLIAQQWPNYYAVKPGPSGEQEVLGRHYPPPK